MFKAWVDQDVRYMTIETDNYGREYLNYDENIIKLTPLLYEVGHGNKLFNGRIFYQYILRGVLHSFFIWCMTIFTLENSQIIHKDGYVGDFWFTSITCFTCIVVMVNIQIALQIKTWNWIFPFIILFTSVGAFWVYQ
jgi:magnesium-transporting ATPase (P-type)